MEEIVCSIATTIFDHSIGAIVREFGCLWNYKKNVENLKTGIQMLDCVKEDIGHSVILAESNADRVRSQVRNWQNNTHEISATATNIIGSYEENANKRCLVGVCPNLVSHYRTSRKACETLVEIDQARSEAAQFNGVADRAVRKATTLFTKGYLTFESRKSNLEEIMKTLKDASKNLIGVYGFGGMGKTTFVKQVASLVAEEKMFDEIVMALVTQTPEHKEIQGQIANTLNLKLKGSSIAERASQIYERLKDKKVLVILDDLWEVLDLEKVGVPFGAELKGCKILLTSRFQHVLSSMATEKDFHLGALEEEEAWSLFEEKTVDVVKDPTFLAIGKKVAKRCAGLPVLIVTVAASLSSRPSLRTWKDTLKQLEHMNSKEMHEIVNSAIESISYKHLEQTHKHLFLLCGVLGSRSSIANLLKYILGWALFDEDVVTVEDARNKLEALILDLKASCLLIDDGNEDIVTMHDVVRGVAISIAKKYLNMISVGDNDTESNRWPKDDALKTCTAIALHTSRNLPCLPVQLDCPLLQIFILSGFDLNFPPTFLDTFFESTRKLQVLDLSGLSFSVLPSSLSFLETLQTLRLDYCYYLKDISILGVLEKLQVLSLVGSSIEELPKRIGRSSKLRLLDLSHCSALKVIPAGLIGSLSQLEELYMSWSFDGWEAEDFLSSNGKSNASLAELKDLPHLRSLEIKVPDAELLPTDLNLEKLERYAIVFGEISWCDVEVGNSEKGFSRKIGMTLSNTRINHLQHGVKRLLERTEFLCLRELKSSKNVINELNRDGFPQLKYLLIQTDYEIQYIANMEAKQHMFFPALESLQVSDMLKLEKICKGRLVKGSFCKLTTVKVQNCNKLESLFSFSMAIGLPCLQEIEVSSCCMLEEIVSGKSREDAVNTNDAGSEKIELVQLRKLSLECLPQLKNFFSCVNLLPLLKTRQKLLTTVVQSEEIITEEEERSSLMPFFKEVSFPRLEELILSGISNLTEIWNDKLPDKSYCNLQLLVVRECPHLVNVISSNLLHLSMNLEVLDINHCGSMEEVFVIHDELDIDKEHNGLAPRLFELSLVDLPKLRCIWSKYDPGILSFKNLQMVKVEKCSSLKYLFTPSVVIGLVQLRTLTIKSCVKMTEVVANEEGETTDTIIFPQLSYLCLEDLPNLTRFCWGRCIVSPSLKYMTIDRCQQLETFCSQSAAVRATMSKGLEENESNEKLQNVMQPLFNGKANFPSLETLSIKKCDRLKYLLTSSNAMCLVCLKVLTVESCVMMKEIVTKEDEETAIDTIVIFSQLSHLYLEDLPDLTTFYSDAEEMGSDENSHIGMQPLFNEKTNFPSLESLFIKNLDSIKSIWHNQLHVEDSFCKLRRVVVSKCANLLNILPSTMLSKIQILEELFIVDCGALEEVFEVQKGVNVKEITNDATLILVSLSLQNLPKLRCIWGKDLLKILSFQNLRSLNVSECESLKHLFPASVARCLHELKWLHIVDCKELKTIVDDENKELVEEEIKEVSTTFMFPELEKVELKELPELECFYPREYTMDCPALELLDVFNCDKVFVLCFLNLPEKQHEKLFSNQECLAITSNDMKMIVRQDGHFPPQLFLNLKRLILTKFHDESAAFSSKFLHRFQHVKTLSIYNSLVQEIFPYEGEGPPILVNEIREVEHTEHTMLLPHITVLEICDLPELKYICKEDSRFITFLEKLEYLYVRECPRLTNFVPSSVSFKFLIKLDVQYCGGLINLIQSSTARSLELLRELKIIGCLMIEEIMGGEGDDSRDEIIFKALNYLELRGLPRLTSFCKGNYSFKFPALFEVNVIDCPNMRTFSRGITITPELKRVYLTDYFSEKREKRWNGDLNATIQQVFSEMRISNLATLTIRSKDMMKIMRQDGPSSAEHVHNLKSLEIMDLHDEPITFPPNFPHSFHNLEGLRVNNCSFQEIFPHEGEGPILVNEEVKLIELILVDLPKLRCIWSKYHPGILNFTNLQKLYLERCASLKYLLTHSIITGLVQLQILEIKSCGTMKEIVGNEEGETTVNTIIFPRLSYLLLEDLPNLTRFCQGSCIEFPSLKDLRIGRCQRLETFCCQSSVIDETLNKGLEENESNEKLHIPMQPLFNEKVNIPSLEILMIENLDNIKNIWHNQFHEEASLCKLAFVVVSKCANLLKIFPTTMLCKIQSLSELRVADCGALEVIFEVQKALNLKEIANDVTAVSQLSILWLNNLPKLRCIWGKDHLLSFQSLCYVTVLLCESLKHVFPASVARNLHQLVELRIVNCKGVETIVYDENIELAEEIKAEEEEVPTPFMFPKLTKFVIEKLPKLEFIYPRKHTLDWPALKELSACDCGKVSALCFPNSQEKQGDNQCQKFCSNLDFLAIRSQDMKIIMRQDDHFPPEFFLNLKRLTLTDFHDESAVFSSKFLHRFHYVECLSVYNSFFQEIFPYEREGPLLVNEIEEVNHTLLLARLKWLILFKLPELKYIWKEDSSLIPILEKLESLQVWECPRLTNLVPGSVSFKFLIKLDVRYCGALINLIQSSAARSLEQLTDLKIIGCLMMEEIVEGNGYGSEDEIIFRALKSLELGDLPRLTNFCKGSYSFKFPSLLEVTLIRCPNMRTFCGGIARTPILQRVFVTEYKNQERWSGDLNTTIQQLFSEMEDSRLTTIVPSSSSNNYFQPEAQIRDKPSESDGKEVEEIHEGSAELGREGWISENGTDELRNMVEIEVCDNAIEIGDEPRKGTEICEEIIEVIQGGKVADTSEKGKGKEIVIREEEEVVEPIGKDVPTSNRTFLESNMPVKSHLYSLRTMPFYQSGESSVLPEQQSEKFEETTPPHSYPYHIPVNTHEKQTIAGSLAPQDAVASSSHSSPASNRPETSHFLVTDAGTSKAALDSQLKDVQGLRSTEDFIPLLSEFLQILQTQPLNSMSSEQFQFIEDAFRDLSNISIDWFSPHVAKARECSLVVDRRKKIAEIEAQLEALKEEKRALEEENEAVASRIDLDKSLHDN